jgi:phenylacetate-coenzyme A ligase PaaK-like adenylate-forming protein
MINWYKFGEFVQSSQITPQIISEVIEQGKLLKEVYAEVPIEKIAQVLDEAGKKIDDVNHPVYKKTLEIMPSQIHFSKEMVIAGLAAVQELLRFDNIIKRLNIDLGSASYLDTFTYHNKFDGFIRAVPHGVAVHISAGNVFVGAVDTIVQGIVTKNINVLKMSSFDPVFPLLFAELIKECDPDRVVYPYFSLIPFQSGNLEIEKILKQESDLLIVYGGKEAVEAYRNGRGLHTKILEYGPKYSCMVIDSDYLMSFNLKEITDNIATDFTMWEQSACSSPHSIFIKGIENAKKLAASLKESFEDMRKKYPFPKIDFNEQVEITRTRELARVEQALGNSELIIPGVDDQSWTIILDRIPRFNISCQHRTAYIIVIDSYDDVFDALAGYGKFIQSIGILAEPKTLFELSERLAVIGADRVTELGAMSRRKHGTPHDGTKGLAEFVRWVSIGHSKKFEDPFDYLNDEKRDSITLARMNYLVSFAKEKSKFYSERLPEKQLTGLDELKQIPILEQSVFKSHLPPYGEGILTGKLGDSISFSSGGTTGTPKFVYRTLDETHYNARAMGKGLYLAGFKPNDVIANLFFVGNLWASFISVNMALEEIGCHILPMAGSIEMDNIISYLTAFKPDGAASIPSVLISIAQRVEKEKLGLKIKKLVYGGEHMPQAAKEYVSKILGTEIIASAGYATNDTGAVGYQCEFCKGSVHHVHEDIHYVEIVDPETNEPLPVGEIGNIIVTNINRFLMPVIRYDVGDRGRLLKEKCACGRGTRLLELLGRSDEVIVIGADNISVDVIASIIAEFKELSQNFRMTAKVKEGIEYLQLEIESKEEMKTADASLLTQKVKDTFLKEKPVYKASLKNSGVGEPVVIILKPGEVPKNPKTGKIRKVIDER